MKIEIYSALYIIIGLGALPVLKTDLLYCGNAIDFDLVDDIAAETTERTIVKPLIEQLPKWLSLECHASLQYYFCLKELSVFSLLNLGGVFCYSSCTEILTENCEDYLYLFADTSGSDLCLLQPNVSDNNCETGPGIQAFLDSESNFTASCLSGFHVSETEEGNIEGTACQVSCSENGGGYSFFPTDTEASIFYVLFVALSAVSFILSACVAYVHYDVKKSQIYLNFSKFAVNKKHIFIRAYLHFLCYSAANQISMFASIFSLLSLFSLTAFLINTIADQLCDDSENAYILFHSFGTYFFVNYAMIWGLNISIFLFCSIVLIQRKKYLVEISFALSVISFVISIVMSLAGLFAGGVGLDKDFNIGIGFVKSSWFVDIFVVYFGYVTCGLSLILVIATVIHMIRLLNVRNMKQEDQRIEMEAAKRKSRRKIALIMANGIPTSTTIDSKPTTDLESNTAGEANNAQEQNNQSEFFPVPNSDRLSGTIHFLERPTEEAIDIYQRPEIVLGSNWKHDDEKHSTMSKNNLDSSMSKRCTNDYSWDDLEKLHGKLSPKYSPVRAWRRSSIVEMDVDDVEDMFKVARDKDLPDPENSFTTDESTNDKVPKQPTPQQRTTAHYSKIIAYNKTIVVFLLLFAVWNVAACAIIHEIYNNHLNGYKDDIRRDEFENNGYHQIWRQFFVLGWMQGFGILCFLLFGSRCFRHLARWYVGKTSTPFANVPLTPSNHGTNISDLPPRKICSLRNLHDKRKIDFIFHRVDMKNLLRKITRKLCCEELFDFALLVEEYRNISSFNLDRQWKKYVEIVEGFVLENKINVSASMKRATIKCYAAPESFTELNMANRYNIFSIVNEEVLLLLNSNVMFSVIKTSEYKKAFEEEEENTVISQTHKVPNNGLQETKKSEKETKKNSSFNLVVYDDSRVAQL